MTKSARVFLVSTLILGLVGCGSSESTTTTEQSTSASAMSEMSASAMAPSPMSAMSSMTSSSMGVATSPDNPTGLPDDLPRGLLIGYSPFAQNDNGQWVTPTDARLEILTRRGGEWQVDAITDSDSNVFHKAMFLEMRGVAPAILTVGGMGAFVKLWRRSGEEWSAETIWTEEFGGRFNRMRDVEIGNIYGDGATLVVATHDQGVVATIRRQGEEWTVTELDRRPNTFVHEIELGDLNGDGVTEIYATPSEPNTTREVAQRGEVIRFVPGASEEAARRRTVVADLGDRHAKEIWVGDVDGDGRDELYVSVEGQRSGGEVTAPVEIRRYEHDTPPDQGVVIATIPGDHLMRFLTVGDVDGDRHREMVAASYSQGLWLLRPGSDPNAEWTKESVDRDSGGFEHASYLTDLDGDGRDELYVSSDNDGELRRYVWVDGRARREVIHRREQPRSMITWNIMSAPVAFLRGRLR